LHHTDWSVGDIADHYLERQPAEVRPIDRATVIFALTFSLEMFLQPQTKKSKPRGLLFLVSPRPVAKASPERCRSPLTAPAGAQLLIMALR
jgi:hypothetical protein